jgi:hypothetical protein
VHSADSSSLFDELDTALQSGSSEKRVAPGSAPKAGYEKLKIDFIKLSKPNAQRGLRFWQVREASARSA